VHAAPAQPLNCTLTRSQPLIALGAPDGALPSGRRPEAAPGFPRGRSGATLFFLAHKVRRIKIRTQEPDAATHAFSEAHWCAPQKASVGSGRGGFRVGGPPPAPAAPTHAKKSPNAISLGEGIGLLILAAFWLRRSGLVSPADADRPDYLVIDHDQVIGRITSSATFPQMCDGSGQSQRPALGIATNGRVPRWTRPRRGFVNLE
jgi:hypothetical protein